MYCLHVGPYVPSHFVVLYFIRLQCILLVGESSSVESPINVLIVITIGLQCPASWLKQLLLYKCAAEV